MNMDNLQWTREPEAFKVKNDTIEITTAPHTDLWQRTYYHFRNDNAPVLQMQTTQKGLPDYTALSLKELLDI
ncbi:MAG: DUF1349 domain-containing protein, partial [Bacteroidales bacterium]|nr:DUF1349 domain-containing protein [Bacteroidales bacterium]